MAFQVVRPTKMDFTVVVATRMMHDFKFEPNWSTLRYLADLPKKGPKSPTLRGKKVPVHSSASPEKNLAWSFRSKN